MSLSTQEANDDSDFILVAKLDNARTLSNILKTIHFKEVSVLSDNRKQQTVISSHVDKPK